jgi:hypothetical protein
MMMRLKMAAPSTDEKTYSGAARHFCSWSRSVLGVRVVTKIKGSSVGDGMMDFVEMLHVVARSDKSSGREILEVNK